MSFDYISYRKTKRSGKYKLNKRFEKMLEMIWAFKNEEPISILDVGAADGYMIHRFKDSVKTDLCLGIEPSIEFIKSRRCGDLEIIQAVGEKIPFKSNMFDVITAASVLDHMQSPTEFLKESRRVLRKNGIIIISLASPFYDKLAVKFKIKENDHTLHFSENDLRDILQKEGFGVLKTSRFALPFFGIFLEKYIEKVLNIMGLKFLMFYIITVGQKQ